jgi:hypothetical protein
MSLWWMCRHRNIVPLFGYVTDFSGVNALVSPVCSVYLIRINLLILLIVDETGLGDDVPTNETVFMVGTSEAGKLIASS